MNVFVFFALLGTIIVALSCSINCFKDKDYSIALFFLFIGIILMAYIVTALVLA